ncbi:MAG: carboxypeptidase regulatory-like domain-containing protein [Thermoanaerobaculia bacterium]
MNLIALALSVLIAITPPANDDATIHLTVTAARYWPAATSIRITDLNSGEVLTRQLSATEASELRGVTLSPGRYRIAISAPRLASVFRDVSVAPRASIDLGELALLTLPQIRGVVRDADGAPLASAEVHAGSSEATTDADGRFMLEPGVGQWPAFAIISARGRGTRVVDVPKSSADSELPAVTLARSAKLRVTLTTRPAGELSAVLQVKTPAEQLAVVRRARIDAAKNFVEFDELGSGAYVLLIRGEQPLQQFATKIILGTGDTRTHDIAIHPLPFSARVSMGSAPMPHTEIALHNVELEWHADLTTDDNGQIAGELWQPGEYTAEYRGSNGASAFRQAVTLGGMTPLKIDLAQREVRGQLLDGDGFPVAAARVFLRTDTDDNSTTVRTQSAQDGSFVFEAVAAGTQHVTVLADGYLIPDEVRFVLAPSDMRHDVPIRLESGMLRTLRVSDAAGHPPLAAEVVAVSNGVVRGASYVDPEGRARIPLPDDKAVIFILGRDGSFAALRPSNDDVMSVNLPAPESSLRISTRTTLGQPLPGVAMVIEYEGEVLPLDVASRFESAHGSLRTDRNGDLTLRNLPAGTYQFWPYANELEAESILASSVPAPIQVNVNAGENAIVVEFQARP